MDIEAKKVGWQGFLDTASKACGPDLLIFPFVILNYNHLAQILNHRCLKGYDISGCRTHWHKVPYHLELVTGQGEIDREKTCRSGTQLCTHSVWMFSMFSLPGTWTVMWSLGVPGLTPKCWVRVPSGLDGFAGFTWGQWGSWDIAEARWNLQSDCSDVPGFRTLQVFFQTQFGLGPRVWKRVGNVLVNVVENNVSRSHYLFFNDQMIKKQ